MKVYIDNPKKFLSILNSVLIGQQLSNLKEEPITLRSEFPNKEVIKVNPDRGKLIIENSASNTSYYLKIEYACDVKKEGEVNILIDNLKLLNKRVPDNIENIIIESNKNKLTYNLGNLGSIRQKIYDNDIKERRSGLREEKGRIWNLIINDSFDKLPGEKESLTPICNAILQINKLDKRNPICINTIGDDSGVINVIGKSDVSSMIVSIELNTEVEEDKSSKLWIISDIIEYIKPYFVDSTFRIYKEETTENLFKIELGEIATIKYIKDSSLITTEYDYINTLISNKDKRFIKMGYLICRVEDFIQTVTLHNSPDDSSVEISIDLNTEESYLEITGDSTDQSGKISLNNYQYLKDKWTAITFYSIDIKRVCEIYRKFSSSNLCFEIYKISSRMEKEDPCFLILRLESGLTGGVPIVYLPSNIKTISTN
ncbi:hypothetical protein V6O07_01215 [Arthrospira platensis SPKY2]